MTDADNPRPTALRRSLLYDAAQRAEAIGALLKDAAAQRQRPRPRTTDAPLRPLNSPVSADCGRLVVANLLRAFFDDPSPASGQLYRDAESLSRTLIEGGVPAALPSAFYDPRRESRPHDMPAFVRAICFAMASAHFWRELTVLRATPVTGPTARWAITRSDRAAPDRKAVVQLWLGRRLAGLAEPTIRRARPIGRRPTARSVLAGALYELLDAAVVDADTGDWDIEYEGISKELYRMKVRRFGWTEAHQVAARPLAERLHGAQPADRDPPAERALQTVLVAEGLVHAITDAVDDKQMPERDARHVWERELSRLRPDVDQALFFAAARLSAHRQRNLSPEAKAFAMVLGAGASFERDAAVLIQHGFLASAAELLDLRTNVAHRADDSRERERLSRKGWWRPFVLILGAGTAAWAAAELAGSDSPVGLVDTGAKRAFELHVEVEDSESQLSLGRPERFWNAMPSLWRPNASATADTTEVRRQVSDADRVASKTANRSERDRRSDTREPARDAAGIETNPTIVVIDVERLLRDCDAGQRWQADRHARFEAARLAFAERNRALYLDTRGASSAEVQMDLISARKVFEQEKERLAEQEAQLHASIRKRLSAVLVEWSQTNDFDVVIARGEAAALNATPARDVTDAAIAILDAALAAAPIFGGTDGGGPLD